MKKILGLFCVLALTVTVWPQGEITDGNARWAYDSVSGTDFQPDSTVDHLPLNWWFYRVNNGEGETLFENEFALPPNVSQSYIGNTAVLEWVVEFVDVRGNVTPIFDARLTTVLTDGGSPGEATVTQELVITNNYSTDMTISVFNYSDWDVSGVFVDDIATISGDVMTITDTVTGDVINYQGVGADAYQAAEWPTLRSDLLDGDITNLDNSGFPWGGADFTGAFQWDRSIPSGQSTAFNVEITAPGPEQTVLPDSFSFFRGSQTGGVLSDLFDSDDSFITVLPGITLNQAERQVQLIVVGTAPTETPTELRFRVEAHAEINNIGQWIELWNYDTNSYEQVDFMIATLADSIVEVSIAVDPGRFIQAGTKQMKARVSYKEAGIVLSFPWLISFDQTVWIIVP
ncbi:MAG: hypothetical protein IH944_01860 [Armatimonadetes bacterium]|nr:hypothetical protein [Armatimonadota bacterium]